MSMAYRYFNPNPDGIAVGDCVIRAICAAFGLEWKDVYMELAVLGLQMSDMPSANRVWGRYLREHGMKRSEIPNSCPDCYTVADFCREHPDGTYILATGTHVVTAMDGDYKDAWDSGREVPVYYWSRE